MMGGINDDEVIEVEEDTVDWPQQQGQDTPTPLSVVQVDTGELMIEDESSNLSMKSSSSESRNVCRKSTAGAIKSTARGNNGNNTNSGNDGGGTSRPIIKNILGGVEDMKFLENFDPNNSSRIQQKKRKRYNQDGRLIQYADDFEDCDCLRPSCSGCHLPCRVCGDRRCGHECRKNRKWLYEMVEIEGKSIEFKNPHVSSYT